MVRNKAQKGIYVSVMEAKLIDSSVLDTHKKLVQKLDPIEDGALAYLVAYDLHQFDLGFAMGTLHPSLSGPIEHQKKSNVRVLGLMELGISCHYNSLERSIL